MAFKNRWRITGRLTTTTPLHVGNGDTTKRLERIKGKPSRDSLVKRINEHTWDPIEISAVGKDSLDRAYLPGTTLKGNLRAWLLTHSIPPQVLEAVFGSEDPTALDASGGKAEFHDAFVADVPQSPLSVPYWKPQHLTDVTASVAINRGTRTAEEEKLFHEEFVPPGISFQISVTGQDLEDEELNLLLFALEGFNDAHNPITLGGGANDQQGCLIWRCTDLARFRKEDVSAWRQKQKPPVGYAAALPLSEAERDALLTRVHSAFPLTAPSSLTLTLAIHFEGPFLVNDPSRTKRKDELLSDEQQEKLPDHAPLRDQQNRIILPARSIRGAIRSQAERIIRTLNPEAACAVTDKEQACAPIDKVHEKTRLCLACQVFGAPGWRSPVEYSDFSLAEGNTEIKFCQQMIAIDRFTGGGAKHLLFDAKAAYQPVLSGTISVDLNRVDPWALGLLALTLRDLIEGDIPLGFGAAKGYGACTATINGIRLPRFDTLPSGLPTILEKHGATQSDFDSLDMTTQPKDAIQYAVMEFIEKLKQQVAAFQRTHAEQGG